MSPTSPRPALPGIFSPMRLWAVLGILTAACAAQAERILLIPLDSRPAAGQFAQMIGNISGVEVNQPPYEALGRFTNPGNPELILNWLKNQNFSDVTAVVVSTDMIAYGGLIASRTNATSFDTAMHRVRYLDNIQKAHPNVKFYGYSAIMRLAPTATKEAAAWRMKLALYAQAKERYHNSPSNSVLESMKGLEGQIPAAAIADYEATRNRDHAVQVNLVKMAAAGTFDYLILGQDDAQPLGPHIRETAKLKELVDNLNIGGKIYMCEGIDQHSNILVSRALLKSRNWTPRVDVVYSEDAGKNKIAAYESKTIEQSVRDQIIASGARPAMDNAPADYTLYLNTPGRSEDAYLEFQKKLEDSVDTGKPTCVADIDLAKDGTADPELFHALIGANRMTKLLAYAGWNTAGNTMGTAIPAANVYLLSKRIGTDPLQRELAQHAFLLHRFVNDYAYHKFTRPLAYRLLDSTPKASREETYGEPFKAVDAFVRKDLGKHLTETFKDQFLGRKFIAGTKEYEFSSLDDVKIFLPWPRAYEVRLEFKLGAKEVPVAVAAKTQAPTVLKTP